MRLNATNRRWMCEPVVQRFFRTLERSKRGILVLSHDGLLPAQLYAATATQKRIISRVRDLHLCGMARVILFTDRHWSKIANCLGCKPTPEIWGVGGLEHAMPDGFCSMPQVTDRERKALEEAYAVAVSRGLEPWTEQKPGGLALRLDGFCRDDVFLLRSRLWPAWARIASAHKLTMWAVKHGIELRVPGPARQHAVQTILAETPSTIPVAYLGTDVLDLPALHVLGNRGLRVLLDQERRNGVADVVVSTLDEIAEFLESWPGAVQTGLQPGARVGRPQLRSARKGP